MKTILLFLVACATLCSSAQTQTLLKSPVNSNLQEDHFKPPQQAIPIYYQYNRTIDPFWFEQMILDFQEATLYPGMSVCLLRDGQVFWNKNYGYANIAESRPITDQTVYTVASISKTIMITAVMQLYEQGMFGLDDDISDHIPLMVRNPNFPDEVITIRQLATHTSSIKDNYSEVLNYVAAIGDNPLPMDEFLQGYLTEGEPYYHLNNFYSSAPGTWFNYSNIGSCLLAYMVEYKTGQEFESYCQEHIFGPLNMAGTSYLFAGVDPEDLATPYWILDDGSYLEEYQLTWPIYPIAHFKTSALQLAKHLKMYMNHGTYGGQQILQSSTVDLITDIHFTNATNTNLGLIWFIDPYLNFYSHTGSWYGFYTIYGCNIIDNYGMIWLSNGNHLEGTSPETDVFWNNLTLYARQYEPFSVEAMTINDPDGDHILEAGESVDLYLTLRNNTNLTPTANNLVISVSTDYPGISFTGDTVFNLGNVAYQEEATLANPIMFDVSNTFDPGGFNIQLKTTWNDTIDYTGELELHAGPADILVVCDETDVRGRLILTGNWYLEALDSLGYDYQYYDPSVSGAPMAAFLHGFPVVIWLTGNDAENTLTEQDQLVLSQYLDNGGKLLLSGQNISEDIQGSLFLSDYLHAVHIDDNWTGLTIVKGMDTDPFFSGLQFSISGLGSTGANNQESPSVIDADGTSSSAKCLGYFPNLEGCGVRFEGGYKTVFLSFGFEGITTKVNRVKVMERVLHYFDLYVCIPSVDSWQLAIGSYPNPTYGISKIKYQIAESKDQLTVGSKQLAVNTNVRITLHEISGKQVRTLLNKTQLLGEHTLYFDTSSLSPGIYLIRLQAGDRFATAKMIKM